MLGGVAIARVGGGEHYESPSGGGGGGGDIPFAVIELLFRLVLHYPKVGIPLVVLVGVGWWVVQVKMPDQTFQKKMGNLDKMVSHAPVPQSHLEERLQDLRQHDPAFDEEKLKARAATLFLRLQAAWSQGRLPQARRYVSDGLFNMLVVAQKLLQLAGVRDMVFQPRVTAVRLLGVEDFGPHEAVHLQITGDMVDIDAPLGATPQDIEKLKNEAGSQPFSETWTLVRRRGAPSREDAFDNARCPGCGAEVPPGDAVRCAYCGNLLNSGQHDWVLCTVTQNDAFFRPGEHPREFDQLRQRDPNVSLATLQDRAQVLFYRWMLARQTTGAAPLKKAATGQFVQKFQGVLASQKQVGEQELFDQLVLAGIGLKQCALNVDGRDHLWLVLNWQARRRRASQGSPSGPGEKISQTTVFELVRSSQALTREERGVSTETCPGCGAPLLTTDTPACDTCGSDLSAGEGEWVLNDAMAYFAFKARPPAPDDVGEEPGEVMPDLLEIAGGPERREAFMKQLVAVARSNGVIPQRQTRLLMRLARRWQVDGEKVRAWLKPSVGQGAPPQDASLPQQMTDGEKRWFFKALAVVAMVDGRLDKLERKSLALFAKRLELPPQEARALLKAVKDYRQKHGLETVVEEAA